MKDMRPNFVGVVLCGRENHGPSPRHILGLSRLAEAKTGQSDTTPLISIFQMGGQGKSHLRD